MPRSTPGGTGAPALPSAAAAGSPGPPPAPAGGRVGAGGGRDGDGAGMVFAWRRFSGWAAPGSPGSGGGARPLGVFQGPLLCKQHICSWTPHSPPRRNPGGTGAPPPLKWGGHWGQRQTARQVQLQHPSSEGRCSRSAGFPPATRPGWPRSQEEPVSGPCMNCPDGELDRERHPSQEHERSSPARPASTRPHTAARYQRR